MGSSLSLRQPSGAANRPVHVNGDATPSIMTQSVTQPSTAASGVAATAGSGGAAGATNKVQRSAYATNPQKPGHS